MLHTPRRSVQRRSAWCVSVTAEVGVFRLCAGGYPQTAGSTKRPWAQQRRNAAENGASAGPASTQPTAACRTKKKNGKKPPEAQTARKRRVCAGRQIFRSPRGQTQLRGTVRPVLIFFTKLHSLLPFLEFVGLLFVFQSHLQTSFSVWVLSRTSLFSGTKTSKRKFSQISRCPVELFTKSSSAILFCG